MKERVVITEFGLSSLKYGLSSVRTGAVRCRRKGSEESYNSQPDEQITLQSSKMLQRYPRAGRKREVEI